MENNYKNNEVFSLECGLTENAPNINLSNIEKQRSDDIQMESCKNCKQSYKEYFSEHDEDNRKNEFFEVTNIFNQSRFSEWIYCMCIVTFDLELGQKMEDVYPPDAFLSEQEKLNICYLAFPDSNSSCMGDTQYHVRLRLSSDNIEMLPLNSAQQKFYSQCISVQKPDLAHYWGFVYFRQKKDKNIPRGYFQKSLIILTRLPFFNLFNEIVSIIAPRYFNDGRKILEIAYNQINMWSPLKAGESYNLNLLGTVYQTTIPKSDRRIHSTNYTKFLKANEQNTVDEKFTKDIQSNCSTPSNKSLNQDQKICESCKNASLPIGVSIDKELIGPTLPPIVLTSVHEIDIFRSLSFFITNIFTLWELVLIGEPIIVMGSSPADCSHMVQSLISLISPLSYLAETRPYFTIHDSEFREFTAPNLFSKNDGVKSDNVSTNNAQASSTHQPVMKSIILGVTNPFFGKLLQNWPNMIKLPENSQQVYSIIPNFSIGNTDDRNQNVSKITSNEFRNTSFPSTIKMKNFETQSSSSSGEFNYKTSNNNMGNSNLINIVTANLDSNNSSGLYSKYKPFLKKDKSLIKKIQLGMKTKRPEQVQSALLRRYFSELTESFMIPLERYMASLMPLQKDISPFKAAPNPHQFKEDDFLATLEQSGPHLTSSQKGNWKGLYKRFFRSPNFKGWYEARYKDLKQTLQHLQLKALSDVDLNKWAEGKQEVEIIDMLLKLKQKLKNFSENLNDDDKLNSTTRIQLLKQIHSITQSLPEDLKIVIQKSS